MERRIAVSAVVTRLKIPDGEPAYSASVPPCHVHEPNVHAANVPDCRVVRAIIIQCK